MRIILCAFDNALLAAWEKELPAYRAILEAGGHTVAASVGDITTLTVAAVVSPANSHGYLRGGVDLAYARRFGPGLEVTLRKQIAALPDGLLPVGEALCVATNDAAIPYLVSAPTMKTPMRLAGPEPVLAASEAAAACARRHELESLAFPGMGTGTGGLALDVAATAMLQGIYRGLKVR